MLHTTLDWRQNMGLSNFREEWKETMQVKNTTGKTYVRGFDTNGHPILVVRPKNENTNNLEGNIRNLVYTMERAIACTAKSGVEKLCLVIDYDGYSILNAPPMKTSREVLSILQDHYPERLFRAYCVRPPMIFYGFYRVISPFIDPITAEKIVMLTSSMMNNSINQLYREIGQENLEAAFGGEEKRSFVSQVFLEGDFQDDFNVCLEKAT
jgi:hypothetical protein